MSPSEKAGPEANALGVITGAVPGGVPRPAGMFTASIGSPNSVVSSSAFWGMPRISGVSDR